MTDETDDDGPQLEARFAGAAALDAALAAAGSLADTQDVAEAFAQAQRDGVPRPVVIDALFEDEPRFGSPKQARALYENLFGLWELVAQGGSVQAPPPPRAPRAPPPPSPGRWTGEAPDDAWVEAAWRHLEGAPKTQRNKWHDAYDNRADALNTWLLEQELSDEGHDTAQSILFETFVFLELGGGAGAVPAALAQGGQVPTAEAPAALWRWAEECLFEAQEDEVAPLAGADLESTTRAVRHGLAVLWAQHARAKAT
ncbi:MAG: hypothetical protein K1X89_03860 [Myxococcaceae bacterium]|nr:hypothetical protein [Myxococcaceae bacterium]